MRASDDTALRALGLLLHGLTGRALALQDLPPAPAQERAPRAILTASHLLLPQVHANPCEAWHTARAAVAHAAAHLLHSTPARAPATLKPLGLAVVSAIEDARVEALLMRKLPGLRGWFLHGLRASVQPQGLSFSALVSRMGLALLDDDHADGNHWVDKARTLFDHARAQHGLEDYEAFRRLAAILANDLGQMRVRFDAQQYAVPAAYRDDNSYLWDFGAARNGDTEPVALQATPDCGTGSSGDTPTAQVSTDSYLYPEWNHRSGVLRPDWCTVIEQRPVPPRPGRVNVHPAHALQLRTRASPARSQRLRRQPEGEEIDLDAAIDEHIDRRLGLAPPGRCFQRPGRDRQPMSLLLLLDLSQSTADRADGSTHTLLWLEQQAALLLARSVLPGGDRIAIHGFSSNTREQVHYHRLLDFGAALDAQAQARVLAAAPAYSTRLGAALRHAAGLLAMERSPLRALIVLSDGAPTDIDVHDTQYLPEDARAAVQEARRLGLQVHGLLVDPASARGARRIFGPGHGHVLANATQLTRKLSALHAHLGMH